MTALLEPRILDVPDSPSREPVSRAQMLAGRLLSGLAAAFLTLDSAMKFVKAPQVIEASTHLGLGLELVTPIGLVLLVCTALYVIPRTAVLGAILLTGYLGGAVFGNLRVGDPLATHVLFPVYFGILLWAGLFLRDRRLRALIPFRSASGN
jgi:DoxX-like family